MAAVTNATTTPVKGEHVAVPAWSLLLLAAAVLGAYLMLQENGLVMSNWATAHELFHDARHAMGFPCH